jgi:hypothetical protein
MTTAFEGVAHQLRRNGKETEVPRGRLSSFSRSYSSMIIPAWVSRARRVGEVRLLRPFYPSASSAPQSATSGPSTAWADRGGSEFYRRRSAD